MRWEARDKIRNEGTRCKLKMRCAARQRWRDRVPVPHYIIPAGCTRLNGLYFRADRGEEETADGHASEVTPAGGELLRRQPARK